MSDPNAALKPQGRSGIGRYKEENVNKFPYEAFTTSVNTSYPRTLTVQSNWNFAVTSNVTIGGNLTLSGTFSYCPVGSIFLFGSSTAPAGFLVCNGETIGNDSSGADNTGDEYETLFNLLKSSWGNAGTEVFGDDDTVLLPDFVGASPAGAGTSSGYTEDESVTFGTKHDDQFQGFYQKTSENTNADDGTGNNRASVGKRSSGNFTLTQPFIFVTDGSNGTPRTGSTTHGKLVGVTFIIKY